jgi:hypothetical protein
VFYGGRIGSAPPGLSDKPPQEEGFDADLVVFAQQSGRDHGVEPVFKPANARADVRVIGPQVTVSRHGTECPCLAVPPQRRHSSTVQ